MALRDYRRKRDFTRTPEPAPRRQRRPGGRLFVIHKHAARRLHYDLRLELDGVLLSWAVPKGPSLDPAEKRLAVQVEDHPVEYASFEGVIPPGQYGAGTVMVWDRGTWEPLGDPHEDYRQGKLKFRLHGQKLRGDWMLVRMRPRGDEKSVNWLLFKERDEYARPQKEYDVTEEQDRSALSGRSMDEIAREADRVWTDEGAIAPAQDTARVPTRRRSRDRTRPAPKSPEDPASAPGPENTPPTRAGASRRRSRPARSRSLPDVASLTGARLSPQPETLRPQLATLARSPPAGPEWLHEIKFDGYRIVAVIRDGGARLYTRRSGDWTDTFPTIARAIEELNVEQAILDGEVVALDDRGRSDFQLLQNALRGTHPERLVYYVFDLPHCGGYDLTRTPLIERRRLLRQIVQRSDGTTVRFSDHVRGQGPQVLEHARRLGVEGIVSKRADSPYEPGRRTHTWLKIRCLQGQEFVIGGFTEPAGSRTGLGALLVGAYDGAKLRYCGRVGTGFSETVLCELRRRLEPLENAHPPFVDPPTGAQARGVHWVQPKLVCQVEFSEWTDDGLLRHPSFKGLRLDKTPRQVVLERPPPDPDPPDESPMPRPARRPPAPPSGGTVHRGRRSGVTVAGVPLSNPDRVYWPDVGVTKLDLARYYERIADRVLPHVVHRPLTLVRCPEGLSAECFYQKHMQESLPPGVRGIPIQEGGQTGVYLVIDDLAGLIALVQLAALEIHPWGSREEALEQPDRLTFDLDPGPGVPWPEVVAAAHLMHRFLSAAGLKSFVKTSGGKGLHVVVPLAPQIGWDLAKGFARAVAQVLARERPQRYVALMTRARRPGKIFIDYLRNGRGATSIAPYSTRARPGAPVSAPLSWDELTSDITPTTFTLRNVPERLGRLKRDPWEGFFALAQTIPQRFLA